ncbi:MAG TPA: hypothetical protein VIH90_05885 [Candidatus Saccharimonadales bacterium]
MSLVVAAYNDNDIVIGWDDPSTYKDPQTGKTITPPEKVQKVRKINDKLALMITGAYTSYTVTFMNNFASSAKGLIDLGIAFEELSKMAKETMTMHKIDRYGIGLAGFHDGVPGFQRIERIYGEAINDQPDYPNNINCYLNGIDEAYQLVADRLKEGKIFSKPATSIIEAKIRDIISECIKKYPRLGEPAKTLVLSK